MLSARLGRMNSTRQGSPRGRCTIIPPHILERLAQSGDIVVAAAAREALIDIDQGLLARRAHGRGETAAPGKKRLTPGTIEGGPVRLISDAKSSNRLPGTTVRGEGDLATGDDACDEAYDGLGATWTLYAQAFERNSLDGKGLPLRASVHYGRGYDNAFWDGTQMVFGDGDGKIFGRFTASLDVIGHELAHGVTEHTAGLMYQGQPGALNESMSDVFGSLVKQRELGQDAAGADWLIGAELLIGELIGQALRSMKAPGTAYDNPVLGKDPQPAHMRDYVDTDDDHGGVHINSGIPNKAFYLAATALGGNSWEAPGHIWYAALTGTAIAADCDFATFARLTQDAATGLYGADSPELAAVTAAWTEVGVLAATPAGPGSPEPGDPAAPSGESVVAVTRSGGFAGRTVRREVALDNLPRRDAKAWNRVLSSDTLQVLETRAAAAPERSQPDRFCYGVACDLPRVDVSIPEQHLPDDLRQLFDRTLTDES